MVGNINPKFSGSIVLPNGTNSLPAPGELSEEDFIKILEAKYFDSSYIGSKVTISNNTIYSNTWIIADVNHDSNNTGQSNCYDLITEHAFSQQNFGSSNDYLVSNFKYPYGGWCANFYNNFNDSSLIKPYIINAVCKTGYYGYGYGGGQTFLPSATEMGFNNSYQLSEGIKYPIFTDDNSRKATGWNSRTNMYEYKKYWTRSQRTRNSSSSTVWAVGSGGYADFYDCSSDYLFTRPIIRVQNI